MAQILEGPFGDVRSLPALNVNSSLGVTLEEETHQEPAAVRRLEEIKVAVAVGGNASNGTYDVVTKDPEGKLTSSKLAARKGTGVPVGSL